MTLTKHASRLFFPTFAVLGLLSQPLIVDAQELPTWRDSQGETGPFTEDPFESLVIPDDEEARAAEASRTAEQGLSLYRERRFEEAAPLLEVSYRLVPQLELLYPLVVCLRHMELYAAAIPRLERFIEGSDLTVEERISLTRELQELRDRFARVTINAEPEGTMLFLGDRPLGASPLGEPLVLNHGSYSVRGHLDGYCDETEEVTIADGRPLDISLSLRRQPCDGAEPRQYLGLNIALWTGVGLTAASAVAMIVTLVMAGQRFSDLYTDPDRSAAAQSSPQALAYAGYGMIGATSAFGTMSLALGIIRLLRGRNGQTR